MNEQSVFVAEKHHKFGPLKVGGEKYHGIISPRMTRELVRLIEMKISQIDQSSYRLCVG
jgi:hypothetical protein